MILDMERKIRDISGNLFITIPKKFCDLYSLKTVYELSIKPTGIGELRLKYSINVIF